MLDWLEMLLTRYGMQHLRYDGKVRSETRGAALVAFRKMGAPGVILISINCGGVELNFTATSRLIEYVAIPTSSKRSNHTHSMDPSWNFAAESQAYDRVHRLT